MTTEAIAQVPIFVWFGKRGEERKGRGRGEGRGGERERKEGKEEGERERKEGKEERERERKGGRGEEGGKRKGRGRGRRGKDENAIICSLLYLQEMPMSTEAFEGNFLTVDTMMAVLIHSQILKYCYRYDC